MNKITISENKTLKLQNVLSVRLDFNAEEPDGFDTEINKLNTYIQTHGAKQIGPLIQYSSLDINEKGEADINMQFMLQADNFIHSVEAPYKMDSLLRVKNCLYARYMGPEDKIKFAYDKLGVYAFENNIELEGDVLFKVKSTDYDVQEEQLLLNKESYEKKIEKYELLVKSIKDDTNYFDQNNAEDELYYSAFESYKSQVEQNTIDTSAYAAYGYSEEQIDSIDAQLSAVNSGQNENAVTATASGVVHLLNNYNYYKYIF